MTDKVQQYRPRLSIEITEKQNLALSRLIPWGVKNALFCSIIDDVIELLMEHGEIVIAAILSKQLRAREFPIVKEIFDGDNK